MPFGRNCEFKNFKACVRAMTGKVDDPRGYCGALMRDTEEGCMHTHKAAADIVEGPWDADAEEAKVRKWASSDGSGKPDTMSWSKYGSAFAVTEGKGDKFGDFGFQHHVVRDGALKLHRKGVHTAWGASMGARAGKPNVTAQAHLKAHRKKVQANPKKALTVLAYIARGKSVAGHPVRLIVRDDPDRPRFWCLEKFSEALRELTKILGGDDRVELEFNPDGDEDAEPLCDLVITDDDDMELVRAAAIKLTLLGVGAAGSQTHAPAGLLVEADGSRVMIDGGTGPGGDAVPKGRLDAWFVTDEEDEMMPVIAPLADERDVKARVGSYHRGVVTVTALRVDLTGRRSFGYSIRIGDTEIVWAPAFGEYPGWAWGADLMFADGVTNYPNVSATAEKSEVKRLVFARLNEQSGEVDPELDFGEWGSDNDVYTPKFVPRPKLESYDEGKDVASESPFLMSMEVTEKAVEKQYTFGVVYKATETKADPELDAHREYIMAEDLQKAAWEYVKTGDRRVYFQHGVHGIIPLGEYVDFVTWPYEVEVELTLPGQKAKRVTTIPANSVWMGVLWNSMGWDLVKSGQIRGFSLGGFCEKVRRVVPTEEDVI